MSEAIWWCKKCGFNVLAEDVDGARHATYSTTGPRAKRTPGGCHGPVVELIERPKVRASVDGGCLVLDDVTYYMSAPAARVLIQQLRALGVEVVEET